jgi:WD40 repeat protein
MKHTTCPLFLLVSFFSLTSLRASPPDFPALGGSVQDKSLPVGALWRLGSARWRTDGVPGRMLLFPDSQTAAIAVGLNDPFSRFLRVAPVNLIDLRTGQRRLVPELQSPKDSVELLHPFAHSRSCQTLVLRDNYKIILRDLQKNRTVKELDCHFHKDFKPPVPAEFKLWRSTKSSQLEAASNLALADDGSLVAAVVFFNCKCEGHTDPKGKEIDKVFLELSEYTIHVWDVPTGEHRLKLGPLNKEIIGLAFSPDGKSLTSWSEDSTVCFWRTDSTSPRFSPWKSVEELKCAAPSPDGKALACGLREKVAIVDLATGKPARVIGLPGADVVALAYSPDGRLIAAAGGTKIRFLDAKLGSVQGEINVPSHATSALLFSADGQTLYSGSDREHVIRGWNVATRKPGEPIGGFLRPVMALGFTPDGERVFTTVTGDDMRYWNALTGKEAAAPAEDKALAVVYWLASSSQTALHLCEEGWVSLFALLAGRSTVAPERFPGLISISTSGKRVLLLSEGSAKPVVTIVDTQTNQKLRELVWQKGGRINAALSPDGKTAVVIGEEASGAQPAAPGKPARGMCMLDVDTGKERWQPLTMSGRNVSLPWVTTSLKFSPDGSRMALLTDKNVAVILSARDGSLVSEIKGEGIGSAAAFTPDGNTLIVSGGLTGSMTLWEVATGTAVRDLAGASALVSPDNRVLALLQGDAITLCDLYSGEVVRRFQTHSGVMGYSFAPDGQRLVTAYSDTTLIGWDASSPKHDKSMPLMDEKALNEAWKDLLELDPDRSYGAMGRLIAEREGTVRFLGKKLATLPTQALIPSLIAALEDPVFTKREAATRELYVLGSTARPFLESKLKTNPPPETRARLTKLLRQLASEPNSLSPRQRAAIRSVQVLERIDSPQAREILKTLTKDRAQVQASRAAREAILRLHNAHQQ